MAANASSPDMHPGNVDLVQMMMVCLSVAIFSLAVFGRYCDTAFVSLVHAIAEPGGYAHSSTKVGLFVLSSVAALTWSIALVVIALRKDSLFKAVHGFAGYLLFSCLAVSGAFSVSADKLLAGWWLVLASAPGALSLLAAVAAATFFSGIHELDDVIQDDAFDEGEPVEGDGFLFSHRN